MRRYAFVAIALFLALAWLPACSFTGLLLGGPATGLPGLLEYFPASLADYHPADLHGPSIYLADLDRMRRELRLPRVTGDKPAARRSAAARLPLQRLELFPRGFAASVADTYEEWGWDLNDVRQALYIPDLDLCVLVGDFRRPEIREHLAAEGYSGVEEAGFMLFTAPSQELVFALRDDALLIGKDEKPVRVLALQKTEPWLSLARHPFVAAVLPHLDGAWAAWLATSGDVPAMDRELLEMVQPETLPNMRAWYQDLGEEAWDLAAVVLRGPQKKPGLSILYHYPSEEEARRDVPLVERNLKEAPSTFYRSLNWADRITVQSVKVQGAVVVARATMADPWNMYAAIRDRDVAWLPIRQHRSGPE